MTDHSNAAKAWARETYATDLRIPIGNVAIAAMDAYDAALASVAMQQYEPPVPARLTDRDDPRIRDGARVRLDITIGGPSWYADEVCEWVDGDEPVYLLAEAPDPDADMRDVLHDALSGPLLAELNDDELNHVLRNVRAAGYDVVKRAS